MDTTEDSKDIQRPLQTARDMQWPLRLVLTDGDQLEAASDKQ